MPIPKPRPKEKSDEFLNRCMGNDVMVKEFPDNKQRAAVCWNSWRKARGEKLMNTHKECKHFMGGVCKLKEMQVDPDGPACPSFEAKGGENKMAEDGRGTGKGVGNDPVGDGGTDVCVCPDCGTEMPHVRGRPCNEHQCPKCGAMMVGK